MRLTRFNPSKRYFLKAGGIAAVSTLTLGAGPCGVSKEKAVRVTGFVIDITKEALPLLSLIGARDIATTVEAKVLPALEKLKDALADADIPDAGSLLENVRSALNIVANALLNLPESPRRTTIIGILTSVRVLLLTVQAFVESETGSSIAPRTATAGTGSSTSAAIMRAFEATRP